jgi:predicted GIY-YIG superfamily endonuclease
MNYYIYHLELKNDIIYVGKTNNPKRRLANHKITYGQNVKMVILDCVKNWRKIEKKYIKEYKLMGYDLQNKNEGGGGPNFNSPHTRSLISKNQPKTKPPHTKEAKKKISISHTGLKKKPCSEARKQKISKANKGKKFNLGKKYNTVTFKKVLQYDLNNNLIQEWNSVKEVLHYLGKKENNMMIYRCLNGTLDSAYKFKWKYKS